MLVKKNMKTLDNDFKTRIKEITDLSNKINNGDNLKILEMMKDHIQEIEERYNNKDDHWAIETCDLIVLCYELLLLEKYDIDDIFEKCLPRFDVKLGRLAKNVS
jgi:hypothetical protein